MELPWTRPGEDNSPKKEGIVKKVTWVDKVGNALTSICLFQDSEASLNGGHGRTIIEATLLPLGTIH